MDIISLGGGLLLGHWDFIPDGRLPECAIISAEPPPSPLPPRILLPHVVLKSIYCIDQKAFFGKMTIYSGKMTGNDHLAPEMTIQLPGK